MRTHSYCLGCKYSLQMYLRSSSSSSTVGCGCNSVLLATCAGDKQSSQSRFPVIPDILPDVCASVVIPRCSPCVCSDRRLLRRLPARTRHCSASPTSSVWRWFLFCLHARPQRGQTPTTQITVASKSYLKRWDKRRGEAGRDGDSLSEGSRGKTHCPGPGCVHFTKQPTNMSFIILNLWCIIIIPGSNISYATANVLSFFRLFFILGFFCMYVFYTWKEILSCTTFTEFTRRSKYILRIPPSSSPCCHL